MKVRYAIRRNPGTGRWILYFWDRHCYRIMGDSDTLQHALEALAE